jgi:hypothetical protein
LQGRLTRETCKGGLQGALAREVRKGCLQRCLQGRFVGRVRKGGLRGGLAGEACKGDVRGQGRFARDIPCNHLLQASLQASLATPPCKLPLQVPPLQTSLASFPCKPPLQTSLANVPCKPPLRALLASPAFIPWDFARALATETERALVLPFIIARLRLIRQIGRPLQLRFLHLGRGCGQAPSWTAASRR